MACLYFNFLPQISLKRDVTGAASCRGRFSTTSVQYMVNMNKRSDSMLFIILAGSFYPFYCTIDAIKPFYGGKNPLELLLYKHKALFKNLK